MLELLYGSRMRRSKLAWLQVGDVDLTQGAAFIRQGKDARDRYVQMGSSEAHRLRRCCADARTPSAAGAARYGLGAAPDRLR
jgi:site-specific recombinase XerD